LTGFCLEVDCLTPGCRGKRVYSITAPAACYDGKATAQALRHKAVWLADLSQWHDGGPVAQ